MKDRHVSSAASGPGPLIFGMSQEEACKFTQGSVEKVLHMGGTFPGCPDFLPITGNIGDRKTREVTVGECGASGGISAFLMILIDHQELVWQSQGKKAAPASIA